MEETYYLIRQKVHSSEQERAAFVFIRISKGKLEHMMGDQIIFSLLELKNGKPRMKKKAVCKYYFYPLNKEQYEFQRDIIEGKTCGDEEIRAYSDFPKKVIRIGRKI